MGQLALTPPADRTLFWAIARATFCAAAAFPCALLLWAGAVREEMSLPNESIKLVLCAKGPGCECLMGHRSIGSRPWSI